MSSWSLACRRRLMPGTCRSATSANPTLYKCKDLPPPHPTVPSPAASLPPLLPISTLNWQQELPRQPDSGPRWWFWLRLTHPWWSHTWWGWRRGSRLWYRQQVKHLSFYWCLLKERGTWAATIRELADEGKVWYVGADHGSGQQTVLFVEV